MNAEELLGRFRSEVVDNITPYLWSDEEVLDYMNDAYRMFVRLIGGVADFTSAATEVDIVASERYSTIDKAILRVMQITRESDGEEIKVINLTDLKTSATNDYGIVRTMLNDTRPGKVRYAVIGKERGILQWVQIPEFDDRALMSVYRLPLSYAELDDLAGFDFSDIGEEHHFHLIKWMQYRAYSKQDADTFDKGRAADGEKAFLAYCEFSKAEWERYKHKTRLTAYGGL